MGFTIIRFKHQDQIKWGIVKADKIYPLSNNYPMLSDFLKHGMPEAQSIAKGTNANALDLNAVEILSPVTPPCNIVCQGKNYADHRIETGSRPDRPEFNLLFFKASSSLSPPKGQVICPAHVKLLDYELELGLVIGCDITQSEPITSKNLDKYVCGLVMANDISARDIQIPQEQWFKGKSFRTFCPAGPYLYMLEKSDNARLSDLQLTLKVNGEIRQNANTRQLLYSPAETLKEISDVMDLSAGDLILTGTAGGVSLKVPKKFIRNLMGMFLSDQTRMRLFVQSQLKNPRYLKNGDVIESAIRSSDGRIDLGTQRLEVTKTA